MKGFDLIIRKAIHLDALSLSDFFACVSDETKSVYYPHAFTSEIAESICRRGDPNHALLAFVGQKIGGYCCLVDGITSYDEERHSVVASRYLPDDCLTIAPCVHEHMRGCGIGSGLMEHVEFQAKQMGKEILVLMGGCRADNIPALRMYLKHGFQILDAFAVPFDENGWGCPINFDMVKEV